MHSYLNNLKHNVDANDKEEEAHFKDPSSTNLYDKRAKMLPTVSTLNAPKGEIVRMFMSLMDPDEFLRHHPIEITDPSPPKKNGIVLGSLNDPRLGPRDFNEVCRTCFGNLKECPGHFGHIKLRWPVFHMAFFWEIMSVLRCVCFWCGRLLAKNSKKLDAIMAIKNKVQRLQKLEKYSITIEKCGEFQNKEDVEDVDEIKLALENPSAVVRRNNEHGCGRVQPLFDREYKQRAMVRYARELTSKKRKRDDADKRPVKKAKKSKAEKNEFEQEEDDEEDKEDDKEEDKEDDKEEDKDEEEDESVHAFLEHQEFMQDEEDDGKEELHEEDPEEEDKEEDEIKEEIHEEEPEEKEEEEKPLKRAVKKEGRKMTGGVQMCHASEVLKVFQSITDDDAKIMGFSHGSHPKLMILTIFPIPPHNMRSTIVGGENNKGQYDAKLTGLLRSIVRENEIVKRHCNTGFDGTERKSASQRAEHLLEMRRKYGKKQNKEKKTPIQLADEAHTKLQDFIGAFLNNNMAGFQPVVKHNSVPYESFSKMLEGKEGLYRGYMYAKHLNFSGRTVITPSTDMDLLEIGLPIFMAKRLTYPEKVSRFNIHRLTLAVLNGPNAYPGAHIVVKQGRMTYLRFHKPRLEIGDIVERHIITGDVVLLNRPPSLHKGSIMAHIAKVISEKTIRLHASCCKKYGADFDGDEISVHIPQTIEARAEALFLMTPDHLAWSDIGPVQDSLLALYNCSNSANLMTRAEISNMMACTLHVDHWTRKFASVKALDVYSESDIPEAALYIRTKDGYERRWTGKQAVSMLIPPRINVFSLAQNKPLNANLRSDTDDVLIIDGNLLCGRLNSSIMGSSRSSCVSRVMHEYGQKEAEWFLSDQCRLALCWLKTSGFTIGASDILLDAESRSEVQELTSRTLSYLTKWQKENQHLPEEKTESFVRKALKACQNQATYIVNEKRGTDRLSVPIEAGVKGNPFHQTQTITMVSQVVVNNKRVEIEQGRALPHYKHGDLNPAARGFIANSFAKGLSPQESYFHCIGSREGLIATSVVTAEAGYLYRRWKRAMESIVLANDGSVRDPNTLLSVCYGDDGMERDRLVNESCHDIKKDLPTIQKDFGITHLLQSPSPALTNLCDWELENIIEALIRLKQMKIQADACIFTEEVSTPIHLERVIQTHMRAARNNCDGASGAPLNDVIAALLLRKKKLVTQLRAQLNKAPLVQFMGLLHTKLSVAKLMNFNVSGLITVEQYDRLCDDIVRRFARSLAEPGSALGPEAAQRCGQPATQMTLDTSHVAGMGESNVSQGLPRISEISRFTKKPKNSFMCVFVKEGVDATSVLAKLTEVGMNDILTWSILYEPALNRQGEHARAVTDKWLVNASNMLIPITRAIDSCNHVVRFVVNREKVIALHKDIRHVFWSLRGILKPKAKRYIWMCSPVQSSEWVIRLRLQDKAIKTRATSLSKISIRMDSRELEYSTIKTLIHSTLSKNIFQGIPRIKKASLSEREFHHINPVTHAVEKRNERVITTEGCNVREVLNMVGVDIHRTFTNDLHEIQTHYGVDAAMRMASKELDTIFKNYGTPVDSGHIDLMTINMSRFGQLTPMHRNGSTLDQDKGYLWMCSFEEMTKQTNLCGLFGSSDDLNGHTANMLAGKKIKVGTRSDFEIREVKRDLPKVEQKQRAMPPIQDSVMNKLVPWATKKSFAEIDTFAGMHYDPNKNIRVAESHTPSYDFAWNTDQIQTRTVITKPTHLRVHRTKLMFTPHKQPYIIQPTRKCAEHSWTPREQREVRKLAQLFFPDGPSFAYQDNLRGRPKDNVFNPLALMGKAGLI